MIGFLIGTGTVIGTEIISGMVSDNPVLGVSIIAATGTPLGYAFEQGLATSQLTGRQQQFLFWLTTVGIVVSALLLGYLIFVA